MSNEDLPQSDELASAYLDGELDGSERAAAAADPTVMSTVDSLARVRAALGDFPAIDPTAKNTAIAAALAEFDATRSASTSVVAPAAAAPAAVVSLQSRRHRAYRVVSGAAAAVIVAVVAVAALNSNGGSDDSASFATEVPAIAAADTAPDLKAVAADAGSTMEAAAPAPDSQAAGSADATFVPVIDTPAALTDYAQSMEQAAVTAAPAGTAAPAATVAAAAPSAQNAASTGYAAVACLSSDQVVIGSIIYKGTSALAVVNSVTRTLQAIADTDCRVLAEGRGALTLAHAVDGSPRRTPGLG